MVHGYKFCFWNLGNVGISHTYLKCRNAAVANADNLAVASCSFLWRNRNFEISTALTAAAFSDKNTPTVRDKQEEADARGTWRTARSLSENAVDREDKVGAMRSDLNCLLLYTHSLFVLTTSLSFFFLSPFPFNSDHKANAVSLTFGTSLHQIMKSEG